MKTKVLLSTLAMASLFAACNNEEFLADIEKAPAVEDAVLLGEGLSLNIGTAGTDTRITEDGNGWSAGDKAGLAWTGKATGSEFRLPQANHMYTFDDCSVWNTRSNIYEGKHFAYYPFIYTSDFALVKFKMNSIPATLPFVQDKFNVPYVSAKETLTADNVNEEAGTIDFTFDIKKIANIFNAKLNVDEAFTGNELLKTIDLTGISISAGTKEVFNNSITINHSRLPVYKYDTYGNPDPIATLAQINNSLIGTAATKALQLGDKSTEISREIKNGDIYNLGNAYQEVALFAAPVNNVTGLAKTDLSVRIDVAGGHFDVKYTENAEKGSNAEKNNIAIDKILTVLTGSNEEAPNFQHIVKGTDTENTVNDKCGLNLYLDLSNFTADYIISNYDEWKDAVNLATALKEEGELAFKLDNNVEFNANQPMNIPEGTTVKVIKAEGATAIPTMIFKGKNNVWNEGINHVEGVMTNIETGAEVTVEGQINYANIINKGTIIAGKKANIGTATANYLHNTDGRVIVKYGAYVYPVTGEEGVVAFEVVKSDDQKENTLDVRKLNNVMNPTAQGTNGIAAVNTLIVRTTLDINLAKDNSSEGDDDRYDGEAAVTAAKYLASLNNIDIELEGGSIVYDAKTAATRNNAEGTMNTSVKDVTAVSGESTTVDVQIANIITKTDATLTVDGVKDILNNKKPLVLSGNIFNEGTLFANTDIECVDINNEHGNINTISDGAHFITYSGTYTQGQKVEGWVNKKQPDPVTPSAKATAVKTAWDVLVAYFAENNCPNATYEDFLNGTANTNDANPGLNSVSDMTGNTPYINFFNALDDWFQSEGMGTLVATEVTAAQLKRFETETGISFGLKD